MTDRALQPRDTALLERPPPRRRWSKRRQQQFFRGAMDALFAVALALSVAVADWPVPEQVLVDPQQERTRRFLQLVR